MATHQKQWTLEELHSLPDDGNKYELVRGELFVTPPPSVGHEDVLAFLNAALVPYVAEQKLGRVYHPRAVVRFEGSEVEPDLMVRAAWIVRENERDWDNAPVPILVVEVLSGSTRRRDQNQKREFYLDVGVAEYWIVDPERESVRAVKRGADDVVTFDRLEWHPAGASRLLELDVRKMFRPQDLSD